MAEMKPGARGQPPVTKHAGKGGKQEMLPSRHAVSQLVGGDPTQRSIGNYAKLTPSGAGTPSTYQDIQDMAQQGPTIPGYE
jgi:hypothetical protein